MDGIWIGGLADKIALSVKGPLFHLALHVEGVQFGGVCFAASGSDLVIDVLVIHVLLTFAVVAALRPLFPLALAFAAFPSVDGEIGRDMASCSAPCHLTFDLPFVQKANVLLLLASTWRLSSVVFILDVLLQISKHVVALLRLSFGLLLGLLLGLVSLGLCTSVEAFIGAIAVVPIEVDCVALGLLTAFANLIELEYGIFFGSVGCQGGGVTDIESGPLGG